MLTKWLGSGNRLTRIVAAMFAAGEQGGWWDPSDFSTMFQDSAGTTPVTAAGQPVGLILDKRLGAARTNQAANTGTQTLQNATGSLSGAGWNITATGNFAGVVQPAAVTIGQWYEISFSWSGNDEGRNVFMNLGGVGVLGSGLTGVSGTYTGIFQAAATGTILIFTSPASAGDTIFLAINSIRTLAGNHRTQATAASRPTLQQDASGYWYLSYDGVDDGLATGSVDFSATSKMSVWTGMRKDSDASFAALIELTANASGTDGGFVVGAPLSTAPSYLGVALKNGAATQATRSAQSVAYAAPFAGVLSVALDSSVATIAGQIGLRINGSVPALTDSAATGTGNFANAPIYFGRRGGATSPFTGREYGTIILGRAATSTEISTAESAIGQRMGIYL